MRLSALIVCEQLGRRIKRDTLFRFTEY